MPTSLKITGLKRFKKMFAKTFFMGELKKQVRKQNKILGISFEEKVRREIKGGKFAKNSRLTELLKGSSKPLIADGDLWASISSDVYRYLELRVGVVRRDPRTGANIALILHEGATIKVTPKMRAWFRRRHVETGGLVKPLKASTHEIRIPPRPFFKQSLIDDKSVGVELQQRWGKAVDDTFRAIARRAGSG